MVKSKLKNDDYEVTEEKNNNNKKKKTGVVMNAYYTLVNKVFDLQVETKMHQ